MSIIIVRLISTHIKRGISINTIVITREEFIIKFRVTNSPELSVCAVSRLVVGEKFIDQLRNKTEIRVNRFHDHQTQVFKNILNETNWHCFEITLKLYSYLGDYMKSWYQSIKHHQQISILSNIITLWIIKFSGLPNK